MNGDSARGHHLEQSIAGFLEQHGYTVTTNVRVAGRSGAIHELDVVGDKSDGLTTFRLVVECKAWASSIDKEVIYKLGAELADLGAARGIVVALSGWTAQAGQAAIQANIELWGPDELRARLGSMAVEEIRTPFPIVSAVGTQCTIPPDAARATVDRTARGRFGLGREEIMWFGQIWLPLWSLQIAITRFEGTFRKVPRITRYWNAYEGISGSLMGTSATPPAFVTVNVAQGCIRRQIQKNAIEQRIRQAFDHWLKVSTATAKQRYAATLTRLGIHFPVSDVAVENSKLAYYPLWIAFLAKKGQERISVVDGTSGIERSDLGPAITANAQLVRESLTPK
jgi:restriction endonuclease